VYNFWGLIWPFKWVLGFLPWCQCGDGLPWIRPGRKTLNLKIKCTRFENICTSSTHNNSSDWLVEANHGFKIRQGETKIRQILCKSEFPYLAHWIFFNVLKNLTLFMTKQEYWCCVFLTLLISLIDFSKERAICNLWAFATWFNLFWEIIMLLVATLI